jgi:uncharacterized protein (DUF433 family)
MTTVMDGHIVVDDRGVAKIEGSRIKVRHLVMAMQTNQLSVEQLHEGYAHLKLSAIHAALAYYYDHREQVDAEIRESAAFADRMRRANPNHVTREELERRTADRGV